MTYTLTLIDTRDVQKYIFSANKLKQNLGASQLVHLAITEWVVDALQECEYTHNVSGTIYELDETFQIEENSGEAEVLFAGGGNAALIFKGAPDQNAIGFTQVYTLRLIENAPGLRIAFGHVEFKWEEEGLKKAWDDMHNVVMPRRKTGNPTPQPLHGLGVTAECAYTGGVATNESEGVLISPEVDQKLAAAGDANDRLKDIFRIEDDAPQKSKLFKDFNYPDDLKQLGAGSGKAGYIAVVHADGNNMGQRLKDYIAQSSQDNRQMIKFLREYSRSVRTKGQAALKAVRDTILNNLEESEKGAWQLKNTANGFNLTLDLTKGNLPLRPIVFGGDDVTFVCAGNLGLSLAVAFIRAFSKGNLADGKPGYACAGVAIVHANYPFAQAYALASDLSKKAKERGRAITHETAEASLVNWFYSTSGLEATWEQIVQARYKIIYTVDDQKVSGNLSNRPLVINAAEGVDASQRTSWEVFLEITRGFRKPGWRQTKRKLLLTTLHGGPTAVSEFTSREQLLPEAADFDEDLRKKGWMANTCVYHDPLEINDVFLILE